MLWIATSHIHHENTPRDDVIASRVLHGAATRDSSDVRALTFDVPPQLINNRTMVPLRTIFEAMGAKVDWDDSTQTASITMGSAAVTTPPATTLPEPTPPVTTEQPETTQPPSGNIDAKLIGNGKISKWRDLFWQED